MIGAADPGVRLVRLANGLSVLCWNRDEVFALYDEIFVQRRYLENGVRLWPGMIVIDGGAHVGMFSIFVTSVVADAVIHAFEPVPALSRVLEANLRQHAGKQAHAYDVGLFSMATTLPFIYYPNCSVMSGIAELADPRTDRRVLRSWLRSALRQRADDDMAFERDLDYLVSIRLRPDPIHVRVKPLSRLLSELEIHHVDLLKLDIQGAELHALLGIDDADWPRVAQIAAEVHSHNEDPAFNRLRRIDDLLREKGFHVTIDITEVSRCTVTAIRY